MQVRKVIRTILSIRNLYLTIQINERSAVLVDKPLLTATAVQKTEDERNKDQGDRQLNDQFIDRQLVPELASQAGEDRIGRGQQAA